MISTIAERYLAALAASSVLRRQAVPSEEVKYEECEKMSLDSEEEGAIIGKATIPEVSDWPVSIRASGCTALSGVSCSGAS